MVEPLRHRQTKGAETDMFEPNATASHLDSTKIGSERPEIRLPFYPRDRTSPTKSAMSVSRQERQSLNRAAKMKAARRRLLRRIHKADQAKRTVVFLRYAMKPMPAKPKIIMAQVEVSGTAPATKPVTETFSVSTSKSNMATSGLV